VLHGLVTCCPPKFNEGNFSKQEDNLRCSKFIVTVGFNNPSAVSKQRENNFKVLKVVDLKAKARIWP
jgi:hypothetical protein